MAENSTKKILVKKADGSTVYLTLAEFRARQAAKNQPMKKTIESSPQKPAAVLPPIKKVETTKPALAVPKSITSPLKISTVPVWDEEDHKSLLDPDFHNDLPMVVKSEEQALSSVKPVTELFVNEAMAREKEVEAVKILPKPTVMSPKNIKSVIPIQKEYNLADSLGVTNQLSKNKPVVKDVVMPLKKTTMSPVDEIRFFALEDWRRLGSGDETYEKMKEKFEALRAENYLTFMDAVDAWHESPLFKEYLADLETSVNGLKKMSETVLENHRLTEQEVKNIIKLDKYLEP